MNGWEDYFRDGKFGKTNLFFVGMFCSSARITVLWMERKQCLRYQHFVGWQQISLIIKSKTLYDCKRLHAAQKECVGSQCIFWVLEEELFDVSQEQISVLCVVLTDYVCYTQTLCLLNIDDNFEDCRRRFHVSQIQILVFCMVASNCVCNIDITAQAWLPEIDVGEALGVLKIDLSSLFWRSRSHLNMLWRPWMAPWSALNRFLASRRNLPGDFSSLGRAQWCRLTNFEYCFDHF